MTKGDIIKSLRIRSMTLSRYFATRPNFFRLSPSGSLTLLSEYRSDLICIGIVVWLLCSGKFDHGFSYVPNGYAGAREVALPRILLRDFVHYLLIIISHANGNVSFFTGINGHTQVMFFANLDSFPYLLNYVVNKLFCE
jgi:hypothetical protein